MSNRYLVTIRLFVKNMEMAEHDKETKIVMEAYDEEQIIQLIDSQHQVMLVERMEH